MREALRVRREKQEVSRLRAIRPLLNLTESLFAETNQEKLIDLVLSAIESHIHADHAMVYRRAAGDSFISLMGSSGASLPEEHARASGGILARADHWDVPIWINLEGPGEKDYKEVLKENDFAGVICVPVQRGGGSMIYVAARDKDQPGFHIADVEMFGLLARQADIALENAKLYEELRAYVRQVEQSQRALIQAEKMSAVGRLTASIAHEVNNPLQAVQNCLHLSQRDELSDDKRENYLQMADEELDRLMSTVQRMLEFYRPGALKKTPTNILDLIEKVLALLDKQLSNQEVEVLTEFAGEIPPVPVVSNQIQQVFFNLILNAMGAMDGGGKINIRAWIEEGSINVDFKDSGPGVSTEVKDTIFEPFVSAGEDGTGLGLSVSLGIVERHGGEMVDDGLPGACFRVIIPLEVK